MYSWTLLRATEMATAAPGGDWNIRLVAKTAQRSPHACVQSSKILQHRRQFMDMHYSRIQTTVHRYGSSAVTKLADAKDPWI